MIFLYKQHKGLFSYSQYAVYHVEGFDTKIANFCPNQKPCSSIVYANSFLDFYELFIHLFALYCRHKWITHPSTEKLEPSPPRLHIGGLPCIKGYSNNSAAVGLLCGSTSKHRRIISFAVSGHSSIISGRPPRPTKNMMGISQPRPL